MSERKCTHPGCDRPHYAKNYCRVHERRARLGLPMNAKIAGRTKITPRLLAQITELRKSHSDSEIGRILGVSKHSIWTLRKKHSIQFVPERGHDVVECAVPPWVPQELVQEYQNRCKSSNEYKAAEWARRMKRAKAFTRESSV